VLRSVKNWLTLLFLGVVLIALAIAYLAIVPPLANRLAADKLDSLANSSEPVARAITNELNQSPAVNGTPIIDRQALTSQAVLIDNQVNARIVVIDAGTRRKVVDSRNAQPITLADYPVVFKAAQEGTVTVREQTIGGTRYATAAVPIFYQDEPFTAAVVLISTPLTEVNAAVDAVRTQFILATLIAVPFTLVSAYLASFFIARRLKRIESGAEALAQGEFGTPIEPGLRDEIGQLATAFNAMGQRLRAAFALIASEKENAEVLLNDLSEGVIGATFDGSVAVANPAAGWLLGAHVEPGVDLTSILPEDLAAALADVRAGGETDLVVFRHGDGMLEGSVHAIDRETEVRYLIVMRNITEQARLDQARRDFIATASHELKTPLFSLSGFMELIDSGELSPDEQREFLTLMRQQVDRLTDLSLELLDLSQVDAGTVSLEFSDVDVVAAAQAVAAEFRIAASGRGVTIDVEGLEVAMGFCDDRRLAQVLRALVDNAVKFSPEGGRIRLDISTRRRMVTVTVIDDGPGVPRKELTRIFERFYRGSAGGNAKQGTGLGLSIARDMAELMDGTLTVRSEAGRGAEFTLQIPGSGTPRA
jgi:signal transduction histidine kinase